MRRRTLNDIGADRMNKWLYLLLAILTEVAGTSALKATEGFKRFWPSLIVVVGYALSFYLLSLTLKDIPVGVAYAIWSGLGLTLITIISWVAYGQRLDAPALIGMLLILAGVVVLQLFSKSVAG
jgi:small multidrug resistance pump